MAGLQVLSAPTNQPTLNPVVQSAPTQPTLAPKVLSAPTNQPKLAPKVVTQPAQPQLNPTVQSQPQGQQETLPVSYGHIIDSIAQAKTLGAQSQDILQAIIKQNPDAPATQDIQKALDGGIDPNEILAKIIHDNYTPSSDDPTTQQPGFVQGLVRGIVNPFLRFGVTAYDALKSAAPAGKALAAAATSNTDAQGEAIKEATAQMGPRNLPVFGKITPFGYQETQTPNGPVGNISAKKTLLDAAGSGAEVAANLVGGEGAAGAGESLLKGSLKSAIKTGVKEGAKAGAVAGFGSGLQQDNASIASVAKSTLVGGAEGAVVGGATAGVPALGIEAYRFGKGIKNFIHPDVEAAFMKALKPTANNTSFKEAIKLSAPLLSDTEQSIGQPVKNLTDLLHVVRTAKQRVWATVQEHLGSNKNLTIDGNKVADAMVSAIDTRFRVQNPAAADRIIATAETYRRPLPVQEAESFLESANTDLHNFYAKSGFKQRADVRNPEIGHVVREAEALRNALNEKISSATGKDFGLLKKQYGALTNFEETTAKRVNVSERQNPDSLAEQIATAQAVGKVGKSILNRNFGDALEGVGQYAASRIVKTRNTSDSLIETAFNQLRKARKR
jgi:hypothetical protein